jgi:site-specific recombinase XerD
MSSLKKEGKYIYIYYRDKTGKQHHQSLKTSSWTVARKIQIDIDNRLALDKFDLYKPSYTMGEAYQLYFNRIAGRKAPRTIETDKRFLGKFIDRFGETAPLQISKDEAEDFISKIYQENSPTTANMAIRHLKSFYNYLIKFNIATENPFNDIRFYKVEPKEIQYFTENEISMILSNANGWLRDWILFAIATGLRLNEIKGISTQDVNLKSRQLKIRVKGNRIEYIPLNQTALKVISHRVKESRDGLIFDEPELSGTVSKKFINLIRKINKNLAENNKKTRISELSFHHLRHTFASLLIQSGVSLQIIKELLRHRNLSTTQIYAHLAPSNLSGASKNIENHLNKFVE